MHRSFLTGSIGVFVFSLTSAMGQVSPQLITTPNQYEFASGAYYASRGATNATIKVHFIPGNPCVCGQVNFETQNVTAIAPQDYSAASGTLAFSGVIYLTFNVPIPAGIADQQTKSIHLVLTTNSGDAQAVISGGTAELYINMPPPPPLLITQQTNNVLNISWVDDGSGLVLERSDSLTSANWTVVGAWPTSVNGRLMVQDTPSGGMAMYRLRRYQ